MRKAGSMQRFCWWWFWPITFPLQLIAHRIMPWSRSWDIPSRSGLTFLRWFPLHSLQELQLHTWHQLSGVHLSRHLDVLAPSVSPSRWWQWWHLSACWYRYFAFGKRITWTQFQQKSLLFAPWLLRLRMENFVNLWAPIFFTGSPLPCFRQVCLSLWPAFWSCRRRWQPCILWGWQHCLWYFTFR